MTAMRDSKKAEVSSYQKCLLVTHFCLLRFFRVPISTIKLTSALNRVCRKGF